MLYKLGFVWKWSELELRGENPPFWVKIAQRDGTGRRLGLARDSTCAVHCSLYVIFAWVWFGVLLIGIL